MVKTEKNKTLDRSPQINDDKSFISFFIFNTHYKQTDYANEIEYHYISALCERQTQSVFPPRQIFAALSMLLGSFRGGLGAMFLLLGYHHHRHVSMMYDVITGTS